MHPQGRMVNIEQRLGASSLLSVRQSVEHRLYHRCFTHRGIDHKVEEMPDGKLDSKVLSDEVCPVPIHGLDKLGRFFLALSTLLQGGAPFLQTAHRQKHGSNRAGL